MISEFDDGGTASYADDEVVGLVANQIFSDRYQIIRLCLILDYDGAS